MVSERRVNAAPGGQGGSIAVFGYTGRLLRVDLSRDRITQEDTAPYADRFLGGRGLCAKIAWDEIPPHIDPFHPDNRLLAMTGPLTGMPVAGAGRTQFGSVAPQVYPEPRYTRSSMGGNWAAALKYAGYDGVIIQGQAERPVYLWICDADVDLKAADGLWGLDTFQTQQALMKAYGSDVSVIAIGPAGENLSRIAIINNETENAAGQGGFGGVMGSKRLKAVAVKGTGSVQVADPKRLLQTVQRIKQLLPPRTGNPELVPGTYRRTATACLGCPRPCAAIITIPRGQKQEPLIGKTTCVEGRWLLEGWNIPHRDYKNQYPELPRDTPRIKDLASRFGAKIWGDKYGINMWEVTLGLVPWLTLCTAAGVLSAEDVGMPLRLDRGEFWRELLRKIAYREGIGDVLAEGVRRAADALGKGHRYLSHMAHGYVEHWVGRGIQSPLPFPYWILSALCWATDSRDPFSDHHRTYELGYETKYLTHAQERSISRRLYGSEKTLDPDYTHKAQRVIWHQNRCCVDECLILCEFGGFPIVSSEATADGFGFPEVERELYAAVTGLEVTQRELDAMGARVFNLERAIMLREGRSKAYDVGCGVIEYLTNRPDTAGITLNTDQFLEALNDYYELRGWDVPTGRPKRETLRQLGLNDVADALEEKGLLPES